MVNRFGFLIILLQNLIFVVAHAATNGMGAVKKIKMEADALFNNHQYEEALHYYLALVNQPVDQGVNNYKIGLCYLSTNEKRKAFEFLLAAKESKKTTYVIHYYLGRVYHEAGHFTQALHHFEIYLEKLKKDKVVFRPYSNVPLAHLIHYEKSPRDVQKVINQCAFAIKNFN